MDVLLTPLIVKQTPALRSLAGRRLAVDAHGELTSCASQVPDYAEVRRIYLEPAVRSDYAVRFGEPDEGGVVRFLCEERAFGRERVMAALERLRQRSLFE